MRIGDLSRETEVSRRLLRYYEEQGLLVPKRCANGYREYTQSDIGAVRRIRALLAAGLPTNVIAQVLQCVHEDGQEVVPSNCPGMVAHLRRENARMTDEITRLQTAQRALGELLATAQGQSVPGAAATLSLVAQSGKPEVQAG